MEHLDVPSTSEVQTCPQTSQHGFGQLGASSSFGTSDTKRDVPGSTASESADPRTQKGSNISRSSFLARRFSKKQAAMNRGSQESSSNEMLEAQLRRKFWRRGKTLAEVDIGEAGFRHQTRNLVLSEVASSTDWYQAIERKDCKTLLTLLRQKGESALLLKTGKAGRTALHVAAIQGSLELVDTIRGFLDSTAFNYRFLVDLTQAIDGRCKMTAEEIVSDIIGYSKEWKKFVFEDLMIGERAFTPDLIFSAEWQCNYELTRDDIKSIEQMITFVCNKGTANEGRYKGLMDSFRQNVDYNFGRDEICGNLFLFHHACSRVDGLEFVVDVIDQCYKGDEEGLDKLMHLRDFQGRTPLHVAVAIAPAKGRDDVLWNLCEYLWSMGLSQYMGVRDGRGWTPLHLAATQPYSDAFEDLFIYGYKTGITHGADVIETEEDCTVLHLAVLHNNIELLKMIKENSGNYSEEWRDMISRRIIYWNSDLQGWSVLALAVLLGNEDIVDALLSVDDVRKNEWIGGPSELPIICLAASTGNTETLRQVLNDVRFDQFEMDEGGRTGLHYAVAELIHPRAGYRTISSITIRGREAYPYVSNKFVSNVAWLDKLHESSPHEGQVNKGYSGKKGCINMLLQAGLDIWQKDNDGNIASPGHEMNDDEFISWWHEKMAKEALDLRNNLNQVGNSISVIGALIATASYVGPLQPPLSYGSDPSMQLSPTSDNTGYAHVGNPYVKIFMVSNSLSFYLAITSIMLAVVPSLPSPQQMPHEALLNELGHTRKTVVQAICVLLLSVVGILVSYATASIAVIPDHSSLSNAGWTYYPALMGGFACLIVVVLFGNRVMRLMSPEMCRWFEKVLDMEWKEICWRVWERCF